MTCMGKKERVATSAQVSCFFFSMHFFADIACERKTDRQRQTMPLHNELAQLYADTTHTENERGGMTAKNHMEMTQERAKGL